MSECVVRIDMPENCECCPMVFTADVPGYHWCAALEQEVEQGLSRPKDCPIICQLPEGHGRLIDADEFLKRAIGTKCFDEDDSRMLTELVGESIIIVPADTAEKYPCKPDIFEQTYEPADVPTASPWHSTDEKPMDGQECIVAYLGTAYWIYEYATYHSDLNKALEEDIFIDGTDGFIVNGDIGYARHGLFKYWMAIEPPQEDA